MTQSRAAVLSSFFQRLESLDAVVRIILSDARLSALLTFRGADEARVRMDYTRSPARIDVDGTTADADIRVTIDADVMHEMLLGRLSPGEALGRRELLLRGSAAYLARFIPLFDFAPLLYKDHLTDLGLDGYARPARAVNKQEADMTTDPQGERAPSRELKGPERALFRIINEAAYAAGYGLGTMRRRFLRNMSLFEVLEALSRGVAAAEPKEKQ